MRTQSIFLVVMITMLAGALTYIIVSEPSRQRERDEWCRRAFALSRTGRDTLDVVMHSHNRCLMPVVR